jgi:D-sedoheptulose 7-phosphate isomerase
MADERHPIASGVVRFFEDLRTAVDGVETSDGAGHALGLRTGTARAADLVVGQTASGQKLMFIGNGASAAIASHQAVDFWKTGRMRAVAFNDAAQLTCLGNDYGYAHVFEKPVEMFADPGDVLIAISSSGRSENIVRAARMARDKRCRVITLSGFASDNPLRQLGDVNFYVPSKSYGHVEVTHLALLHAMLDAIVAAYGSPPTRDAR